MFKGGLFDQAFWLDAVCGTANWDTKTWEHAKITYHFRNNIAFKTIVPAPFSPYTYFDGTAAQLINLLQTVNFAELYLYPGLEFAIPEALPSTIQFSSKHSRIINHQRNSDFKQGFKSSVQRQIRKASQLVVIKTSTDAAHFYTLLTSTFQKRGAHYTYTSEQVEAVVQLVYAQHCGELLAAVDANGAVHAMGLFVHDEHSTYYLAGGFAQQYKQSGAMSLLLATAIEKSLQHSNQFDFCGSSIGSIDHFFENFGAQKVPVMVVKKEGNLFFKTALKGYRLFK